MIKHTKKAILSSIIQTFISNFIGENIYIKSLNKFINDNINDLNNMYKTNKEKYLTLLINKFQQLYQNSYNSLLNIREHLQLLQYRLDVNLYKYLQFPH